MHGSKAASVEEALTHIRSGQTIMLSGFTNVGSPNKFIVKMAEAGITDIDLISNDAGNDHTDGIGTLICQHRVRRLTASHVGLNPKVAEQMNAGTLEVVLVPQGTLAERIRCGGTGLGGVLTPTGIGTVVAEGKQVIQVDGRDYLLEKPLHAEVAVVKAWKADTSGNLVYRRAGRNFNPLMAMAADFVIAEVEELVEVGQLDPDEVMTPGVCVDLVVKL
ncbi:MULTISPECIES: CoA transferase subunit A [Eubacteriales]|uniref:Acetate CoA/acetoacetate CoA-transferase alpha subunit n=1 Tax=Intestinimonas butyriciproducens TaxID=1297617 RepID=A0A0S2W8A6_9FIRM|nr:MULTISPECIES: CoA transferase subunit A [Eubacteriales]SCJ25096.1 Acetate CoA-transferase subunit alpha [uncultured Clostridium sp.]ALP95367.1 Butyrate-acetoacetate CoA-transferase subunit A [Intestinimonas butyriciproducens]MCI6053816.1 CoA transferase subunit A [Dysosmobacter sp.]MCI6363348.1 CoA transferase subunit A [Intestinimonas butyriciproducens]MCR1906385.1 CoA transferase subunit A [Intestinimonas butyriciproducens]